MSRDQRPLAVYLHFKTAALDASCIKNVIFSPGPIGRKDADDVPNVAGALAPGDSLQGRAICFIAGELGMGQLSEVGTAVSPTRCELSYWFPHPTSFQGPQAIINS